MIPEDQVIGELADGVVAFAVCPVGLLGREVRNRDIAADEPFAFVMCAVQLVEQDGAEGGCGFLLRSAGSDESQGERQRGMSNFMRFPRERILDSIVPADSLVCEE